MPSNRHTPCPPRCTFVQDSTWHRMGTSSFNNDPGRTTGRTTGRLAIPSEKHHTSTAKVPRRFHRSENLSTFLATYSHNFTKKVQLLKKEGSSNVKSGPGTRPNRCRGVLLKASSFDPWHCVGGWWILVEMTQLHDTSGLSVSLRTSTVTERLTVYLIEVLFLCIVYFLHHRPQQRRRASATG